MMMLFNFLSCLLDLGCDTIYMYCISLLFENVQHNGSLLNFILRHSEIELTKSKDSLRSAELVYL
jgi:hypothetical protein